MSGLMVSSVLFMPFLVGGIVIKNEFSQMVVGAVAMILAMCLIGGIYGL